MNGLFSSWIEIKCFLVYALLEILYYKYHIWISFSLDFPSQCCCHLQIWHGISEGDYLIMISSFSILFFKVFLFIGKNLAIWDNECFHTTALLLIALFYLSEGGIEISFFPSWIAAICSFRWDFFLKKSVAIFTFIRFLSLMNRWNVIN